MFEATDFIYDNIYSGTYGLKIASFNSDALEETPYVTPNVSFAKPAKGKKFFYEDTTYDEPPHFEFTVVCETAIHEPILSEIMTWLDSRRGFKELTILQPDFEEQTYKCIFSITNIVYHAGSCVGFNLSATFDSLYQYGKPSIAELTSDGTKMETIQIFNLSDDEDDYIYPVVAFKLSGSTQEDSLQVVSDTGGTVALSGGLSVESDTNGNEVLKNIIIINETDDKSREFWFADLDNNACVTVDNEKKIITSENTKRLLPNFSKKWLRLKKGLNILKIQINGKVTITCPQYKKIKF